MALGAWIVAGVMLSLFKGSTEVPVAAVVGVAGLVFIWANGAYWWVILRYPYIDMGNGKFVSRDEWKGESHGAFLDIYFVFAAIASVACLRVAFSG